MVVGAAAKRPSILAILLSNRQVVDAGVARRHQTGFTEFPILIAIRTIPVIRVVVPLVREAYGDTIVGERP